MTTNEEKTEHKTEKRPFTKGGPGGPGRGKTKSVKWITLEEIEGLLQLDLRSKDWKVRYAATKLLLALRRQSQDTGNETVIDPAIRALLGDKLDDLLADDDMIEGNDVNIQ